MKTHFRTAFKSHVILVLLLTFLTQQFALAAPSIHPGNWQSLPVYRMPFTMPEHIARIEDSYKSSSQKLIYLIQDAHTNESGQRNLAKALDLILKNEDMNVVYAEGGQDENSFSYLKPHVEPALRERVAQSYLRKGLLQGTEYLSVTGEKDFHLWGVENRELYVRAIEAYAHVVKSRPAMLHYLNKVKRTLVIMKTKIYSPALLALDELKSKYEAGDVALTEYIHDLNTMWTGKPFKHLKALEKLQKIEKTIDFNKANEELSQGCQQLPKGCENKKELDVLKQKNAQQMLAFFVTWQQSLNELDVDVKKTYPATYQYIRYLKAFQKINPEKILEEQAALEESLFASMASTEDEVLLIQFSKGHAFLKQLFEMQITPENYKKYLAHPKHYDIAHITGFLNKKIMEFKKYYEGALLEEGDFEESVGQAKLFYDLTYQRDQAILKNVMENMEKRDIQKAVLVAGGFHAEHLKYLLRKENISYVSLQPQVLHETNHGRYESLLLSQIPKATSLRGGVSSETIESHHANVPLAHSLGSPLSRSAYFQDNRVSFERGEFLKEQWPLEEPEFVGGSRMYMVERKVGEKIIISEHFDITVVKIEKERLTLDIGGTEYIISFKKFVELNDIEIHYSRRKGGKASVGFEASDDVKIYREEEWTIMQQRAQDEGLSDFDQTARMTSSKTDVDDLDPANRILKEIHRLEGLIELVQQSLQNPPAHVAQQGPDEISRFVSSSRTELYELTHSLSSAKQQYEEATGETYSAEGRMAFQTGLQPEHIVLLDNVKIGEWATGAHDFSGDDQEKLMENLHILKEAKVVVVRSASQLRKVMPEKLKGKVVLLDQLPSLQLVIRSGHGIDNVDAAALQERDIQLVPTKGSGPSIAAWIMRSMAFANKHPKESESLMVSSPADSDVSGIQIPTSFLSTESFESAAKEKLKGVDPKDHSDVLNSARHLMTDFSQEDIEGLKRMELGIIGATGVIGRALAESARKDLSMKVLGFTRSLETNIQYRARFELTDSVEYRPKNEIYAESAFIVLTTGLTPETEGMVSKKAFDLMSKNRNLIALINSDRKQLVDEYALLEFLNKNPRVIYIVDEKPDLEALQNHSQVFYTLHIAGSTPEAKEGNKQAAIDSLDALNERLGEEPQVRMSVMDFGEELHMDQYTIPSKIAGVVNGRNVTLALAHSRFEDAYRLNSYERLQVPYIINGNEDDWITIIPEIPGGDFLVSVSRDTGLSAEDLRALLKQLREKRQIFALHKPVPAELNLNLDNYLHNPAFVIQALEKASEIAKDTRKVWLNPWNRPYQNEVSDEILNAPENLSKLRATILALGWTPEVQRNTIDWVKNDKRPMTSKYFHDAGDINLALQYISILSQEEREDVTELIFTPNKDMRLRNALSLLFAAEQRYLSTVDSVEIHVSKDGKNEWKLVSPEYYLQAPVFAGQPIRVKFDNSRMADSSLSPADMDPKYYSGEDFLEIVKHRLEQNDPNQVNAKIQKESIDKPTDNRSLQKWTVTKQPNDGFRANSVSRVDNYQDAIIDALEYFVGIAVESPNAIFETPMIVVNSRERSVSVSTVTKTHDEIEETSSAWPEKVDFLEHIHVANFSIPETIKVHTQDGSAIKLKLKHDSFDHDFLKHGIRGMNISYYTVDGEDLPGVGVTLDSLGFVTHAEEISQALIDLTGAEWHDIAHQKKWVSISDSPGETTSTFFDGKFDAVDEVYSVFERATSLGKGDLTNSSHRYVSDGYREKISAMVNNLKATDVALRNGATLPTNWKEWWRLLDYDATTVRYFKLAAQVRTAEELLGDYSINRTDEFSKSEFTVTSGEDELSLQLILMNLSIIDRELTSFGIYEVTVAGEVIPRSEYLTYRVPRGSSIAVSYQQPSRMVQPRLYQIANLAPADFSAFARGIVQAGVVLSSNEEVSLFVREDDGVLIKERILFDGKSLSVSVDGTLIYGPAPLAKQKGDDFERSAFAQDNQLDQVLKRVVDLSNHTKDQPVTDVRNVSRILPPEEYANGVLTEDAKHVLNELTRAGKLLDKANIHMRYTMDVALYALLSDNYRWIYNRFIADVNFIEVPEGAALVLNASPDDALIQQAVQNGDLRLKTKTGYNLSYVFTKTPKNLNQVNAVQLVIEDMILSFIGRIEGDKSSDVPFDLILLLGSMTQQVVNANDVLALNQGRIADGNFFERRASRLTLRVLTQLLKDKVREARMSDITSAVSA